MAARLCPDRLRWPVICLLVQLLSLICSAIEPPGTDNQEIQYEILHDAEDSSPHSSGLQFSHDEDAAGDQRSRDQVDYYTTVLREALAGAAGDGKVTEVIILIGATMIALTLVLIVVCACAVCLMLRLSKAPPAEQLNRDQNSPACVQHAMNYRNTFVTPEIPRGQTDESVHQSLLDVSAVSALFHLTEPSPPPPEFADADGDAADSLNSQTTTRTVVALERQGTDLSLASLELEPRVKLLSEDLDQSVPPPSVIHIHHRRLSPLEVFNQGESNRVSTPKDHGGSMPIRWPTLKPCFHLNLSVSSRSSLIFNSPPLRPSNAGFVPHQHHHHHPTILPLARNDIDGVIDASRAFVSNATHPTVSSFSQFTGNNSTLPTLHGYDEAARQVSPDITTPTVLLGGSESPATTSRTTCTEPTKTEPTLTAQSDQSVNGNTAYRVPLSPNKALFNLPTIIVQPMTTTTTSTSTLTMSESTQDALNLSSRYEFHSPDSFPEPGFRQPHEKLPRPLLSTPSLDGSYDTRRGKVNLDFDSLPVRNTRRPPLPTKWLRTSGSEDAVRGQHPRDTVRHEEPQHPRDTISPSHEESSVRDGNFMSVDRLRVIMKEYYAESHKTVNDIVARLQTSEGTTSAINSLGRLSKPADIVVVGAMSSDNGSGKQLTDCGSHNVTEAFLY